ncbi:hypothetical protein ScPMuIL_012658 [Solemya velum]
MELDCDKETSEALSRDLESLSVRELKIFLRERGSHVSGTKCQLRERVKGVQELGRKTRIQLNSEDKEKSDQRNIEKFTSPLGEILSKPWDIVDGWEDSVENIPSVRNADLYNYLVLNRNRTFDAKSTKAKRQLKAKVFYEDKHVHSIKFHSIGSKCSHSYVKSKVIPSLPTGTEKQKPDYDVWVCLSKMSGQVHAAGCTCTAGEGESCNHIAALLYALIDITDKKKDGLDSSTSAPCKWNMPRKRKLSPRKAQNLIFKKHKFDLGEGVSSSPSARKKLQLVKNIEKINTDDFAAELKKCAPHAAFLLSDFRYFVEESTEKVVSLPDQHPVKVMYRDNVDLNSEECQSHFRKYFEEMNVSESDCELIQTITKGQCNNVNWKKARFSRLTSSNFGTICKRKDSTAPDCLLKTIMGYSDFDVKSVRWGSSHEAAARKTYHKIITKTHPKLRVFQCGLIVHPTYPHLGSSPDALLFCEHCDIHEGVLEIKCPYKWRTVTPFEAAKDKTFCCEIIGNKIQLKKNHAYYYQIQGQLAITGRKWCDFFVWTLKGHSMERIHFEKEMWKSMSTKLKEFYVRAVIPELFSLRVKRGLALY